MACSRAKVYNVQQSVYMQFDDVALDAYLVTCPLEIWTSCLTEYGVHHLHVWQGLREECPGGGLPVP